MADFVRYQIGDVVQLKKSHPCGSNEWEVLRIGVELVGQCGRWGQRERGASCGWGVRVLVPRPNCVKAVRKIIRRATPEVDG